VWPRGDEIVRAAWVENIMTKTTCHTEVHELSLEELDSASGGVELLHEEPHSDGAVHGNVSRHYTLKARMGYGL
jgi:hypothetical protein